MSALQVHAIKQHMQNKHLPSTGQAVTVIAIDNNTGKTISRQFPSFEAATQWCATDAAASNLEVVNVS